MSEPTQFALSIRQPWAWLILHAGKDVENRTWPTKFRGPVFIHASSGFAMGEYLAARRWVADHVGVQVPFPEVDQLQFGGIVGEMEIVAVAFIPVSRWWEGPYGFKLRNARPLPFQQCKGALKFFRVQYLRPAALITDH